MQLYIGVGFSLPSQAPFFLICTGDSTGGGYCLHVMPRLGASFTLVGDPSSDGVTIKMPYGVHVLH